MMTTNSPLRVAGFATGVTESPFVVAPHSIPLLSSFFLKFSHDGHGSASSHRISTIMIQPDIEQSRIAIGCLDETAGTDYFYNVFYHVVDNGRRDRLTAQCSDRHCVTQVSRPSSDHIFAISGFRFSGQGAALNLDQFSVLEHDGVIQASFTGNDAESMCSYSIDYAYVPVALIVDSGTKVGKRAKGAASFLLSGSGRSVITGFEFKSREEGDLVSSIGIWIRDQGYGRRVELRHERGNADHHFDWEIRWATLK